MSVTEGASLEGPRATTRAATLAGSGALVLWAFLAPLSRLAQPLPSLLLTGLAFGLGGMLALGLVAARGDRPARRVLRALRQPPAAWVHGVAGLFGFHALYFAALALAPPVEANLLNYTWPLMIVLLSAPVLGLPLGARRLAGVGLGAGGAALLMAGGGAAFHASAVLGFAAALGSAVIWAVYSVLAATRRFAGVPTEAVAGFCLASAALSLVAHAAFEPAAGPIGATQWLAIALLGLGPMGAAFFLWDVGMKRGDPRLLGTLGYATPVASTLLLAGFGLGALTWQAGVAAALVAGGGLLAASAAR
ncbi:MAG: DMT family transporter [Acetobacteraceae bacterium]|nr:DMT family transporter [Acetobacteraceae bacterium]